jgi:hypothetical protein
MRNYKEKSSTVKNAATVCLGNIVGFSEVLRNAGYKNNHQGKMCFEQNSRYFADHQLSP